jgi:hypothetical protein
VDGGSVCEECEWRKERKRRNSGVSDEVRETTCGKIWGRRVYERLTSRLFVVSWVYLIYSLICLVFLKADWKNDTFLLYSSAASTSFSV